MPAKLPKSGYRGLKWNSPMQIWEIYGSINGTKVYLGSDTNERSAALKYDIWAASKGKPCNILRLKK